MELYAIICDITYMSEFTLDILLWQTDNKMSRVCSLNKPEDEIC